MCILGIILLAAGWLMEVAVLCRKYIMKMIGNVSDWLLYAVGALITVADPAGTHSKNPQVYVILNSKSNAPCIHFRCLNFQDFYQGMQHLLYKMHGRYVNLDNFFGLYLSCVMKKPAFAYAKTKTQISFAITAKLISSFVFATWIVQSLYFVNPKFQASSHIQKLCSLVCVWPGPCWKPRRPVILHHGSIVVMLGIWQFIHRLINSYLSFDGTLR